MLVQFDSAWQPQRLVGAYGDSGAAAGEPHRVLRLPQRERDPVRIILAAQIQLRRWRRLDAADRSPVCERRVREIVAAREILIRRTLLMRSPASAESPANPAFDQNLSVARYGGLLPVTGG